IRLPMPVVILRAYSRKRRIEEPALEASDPFAKIARVLMQQSGQDSVANYCPVETVGVGGSESFGIARHTLAIARMSIARLTQARIDSRRHERERVRCTLER